MLTGCFCTKKEEKFLLFFWIIGQDIFAKMLYNATIEQRKGNKII